MIKFFIKKLISTGCMALLLVLAFVLGMLFMKEQNDLTVQPNDSPPEVQQAQVTAQPTNTQRAAPTNSPTPTNTLRPPPTFEPATNTPPPSPTRTPSPTYDFNLEATVPPGLHGLETATPTSTTECKPREDWKLIYEVQPNDALASIAERYGTYTSDLVAGNCITDPNVIVVGQKIRVPGEAHPVQPEIVCESYEAMTPMNGSHGINNTGTITFNWRGTRGIRNLIRVYRPDGTVWERVIDLRQNETVDVIDNFPMEGDYIWYVYPLNYDYVQVCPEGGPWLFHKFASPTKTPTMAMP